MTSARSQRRAVWGGLQGEIPLEVLYVLAAWLPGFRVVLQVAGPCLLVWLVLIFACVRFVRLVLLASRSGALRSLVLAAGASMLLLPVEVMTFTSETAHPRCLQTTNPKAFSKGTTADGRNPALLYVDLIIAKP